MAEDDIALQIVEDKVVKDMMISSGDLIQNLPVAVYTCDALGYITQYNNAAVELWGREPELGKERWNGAWRIFNIDGSPMALTECPTAVAMSEQHAIKDAKMIIERPKREKIIVTSNPSPLFDTEGRLTGCVDMLQTFERRLEEKRAIELEKVNETLAKTNNELEEFAYIASHDLQEPLRKIKVFADRVLTKGQEVLPEDMHADLQKIVASSDKMSVLIKDLLNYATLQPLAIAYQHTDLNMILASVLDDLDIIIANKEAVITADILPVIDAIPLQLNQLFYNLINNSLKFSAQDRKSIISIQAEALSAEEAIELQLDAGSVYYKLQFTDNGIGFSEAYSRHIFTIFQRLNNKDRYPGTGIGLALCKKVVSNHHGLIFAHGKENEGATFTIILPAKQSMSLEIGQAVS